MLGSVRLSYALLWNASHYVVGPGSFTIGRSSTCDLVIDDPRVSRVHATILAGLDSAMIQDAGSQNGVLVNQRRIAAPHVLVDGDLIAIGSALLTVSVKGLGDKAMSRDQTMPAQQVEAIDRALGRHARSDPRIAELSTREREVLVLVARGHSMREVGEQLGLSPKTVEGYRARVAEKLGLRTRAEMVRFALDNGLLGG
jgi:DNA-binding CsgD family transcriptional regulator